MAAKTSSQVLAWQKAERFLHTALVGEQGHRVTGELSERVPESTAFHAAREGMAMLLRAQIADLVEKDNAVFAADARLMEIKRQRDVAKRELSDLIVSIRQVLKAIYKAPGLERLGLEGRTGRTIEHLLRQAGRLAGAAKKDLTAILGEPRFNEGLDPRPQMERIGEKAETLEALARQLDEARRDRDTAGVDRNLALEAYKKAHLATTQTFEAWCRLAGEDALAEKVRDARVGRRRPASQEAASQEETVFQEETAFQEEVAGDQAPSVTSTSKEKQALEGPALPHLSWLRTPLPGGVPTQSPRSYSPVAERHPRIDESEHHGSVESVSPLQRTPPEPA